ncbi:MAG: hypothetical protein IPL50_02505 [Chitinophagaceae bacterium]|nr:hypothetical protein [Chitinophagaceae bacterium]
MMRMALPVQFPDEEKLAISALPVYCYPFPGFFAVPLTVNILKFNDLNAR